MADYIDKNILCQAYIHVELEPDLTSERLEEIKDQLKRFTEDRAKFFVYPEVDVDVEFQEGSLKVRLSIAGAIFMAISNYGNFRTGIDFLHTDIKRLADSLVSEALFSTRARHDRIVHTEARTGVIGSLKVLLNDLETLEASIGQISVDESARRIKRLHDDAARLLENIRAQEDARQVETEMDKFTDGLPANCPHPKEKTPDDAAILLYHEALAAIRRRFGKYKKIG